MRLITVKPLKEFWEDHRDAEPSLRHWVTVVKSVSWKRFADVRISFNTADQYGHLTIFDIAQNKYRLIVAIHYKSQIVFVRHILTHKDYDRGSWKNG